MNTHARTFSLAARFLPGDKRRGAFALYAFCRTADDIVDDAAPDAAARRDPANALGAHRAALEAALAGAPRDAVFAEVAWTVDRFGVPAGTLYELLDGVGRDLHPVGYATWDALREYCNGVAGSVGEMCTHVFAVQHRPDLAAAVRRGRTLGLAMQLTNILRDVGEDARRGRCYLPDDALRSAGLTRDAIAHDASVIGRAEWRELMRGQVALARRLYAEAMPGIALLAVDAQRCAAACARGYAAILDAVEARAYDTITTRAVVPRWKKASLMFDVLRGAAL